MSWVQIALQCDCCGARSDPVSSYDSPLPTGWTGSSYASELAVVITVQSRGQQITFTHLCPTCTNFTIKELISQAIRKLQAVQ